MNRIATLIVFNLLGSILYSQEISIDTELDIKSKFLTYWIYFRMIRNPLLSYEETHDEWGGWKNPWYLIPENFYTPGTDINISHWGKNGMYYTDSNGKSHWYLDRVLPDCYLVEKKDGLLSIKKDLFTGEILDSVHLNIYDSIFPYDNRFLACYIGNNRYTFHSGNAEWGDWKDVGLSRNVAMMGYIRGVQFGVEKVRYYNAEFSSGIRKFRPDYPEYEYSDSHQSLLTNRWLLIGAPKGKEDQLVEFIYYSHRPAKTGDPDIKHYYEMRYILPTDIKSVKERRLEIRRLSDEEQEMLLNQDNGLFKYIEFDGIIEEEEIIIKNNFF